MSNIIKNRIPENKVDIMFVDRWSPRSFVPKPLTDFQIKTLFEAARWAPSCYNEQPWIFLYATKPFDKKIFLSLLHKKNQSWAVNSSLLIFALVHINFKVTQKENKYAIFDLGSAWLSIALQARKIGLFAHAMAGFDKERAYKKLGVSKNKYKIVIAIAVGYRGSKNNLEQEFKKIEFPNDRNMLREMVFEGLQFHKNNNDLLNK